MKTTVRLSILLITIFFTSSCFPGKELSEPNSIILPLSDTVRLTEGSIVYGLPRTVFTVFVGMERTIEIPGPYARFAGDLLGLNDVILNESESWSITGITVKTHEELDPSKFYVIESNTLFQTNILALKKEGLILDLNPEIFYSSEKQSGIKEPAINQFRSFDLGSDEYFQVQSDTAYKRVNIDSSFIRIPYLIEKKKKFTVDQLAEKAAKRLMEMREGKHLILTGEANVFPQNEAAITEINRLEKEYTELFTGKTFKETRTFTYQIIPGKEMAGKPVVMFQFSELTGPVTGTMKGGKPVTVELKPEQKTKDLTIITKKQTEPEAPGFDKLFYRIPDVVNMKISIGAEVLFNSRKLIYQFGEVIQLPANYIIGK
ncbi:MAG: DUF4831 family protein [Bacteroidia bacterium]|nr:DUF4831 family protein [Bacteroidia bacterium]